MTEVASSSTGVSTSSNTDVGAEEVVKTEPGGAESVKVEPMERKRNMLSRGIKKSYRYDGSTFPV